MTHRRWLGALATIAALSLMGNVYFITRPPSPAPQSQQRPILPSGTQLGDLRGHSETGDEVQVQLVDSDRPTLLYVVTPSCIWCTRNRDNFLKLAAERSGQYNIVLLSLTNAGFPPYVDALRPMWRDAEVRVLTGLSREVRGRMMLGSTPQTMVVGTDGRIIENWVGAYTGDTLIAVENFFLLQMPGLGDGG